MKKIYAILLLTIVISSCRTLNAQETLTAKNDEYQSIVGGSVKITGWYIAFSSNYSKIYNTSITIPGFEGGIVINRNLTLGFKGHSLSRYEQQIKVEANANFELSYLTGGYGGLVIEPRVKPSKLVHVTFPCLFGAGGMALISRTKYLEWDDDKLDDHRKLLQSEPFFVIEPGIALEINVAKFMRLSGGISYRYISGNDLAMIKANSVSGPTGNFSVKFGRF